MSRCWSSHRSSGPLYMTDGEYCRQWNSDLCEVGNSEYTDLCPKHAFKFYDVLSFGGSAEIERSPVI